MHTSVTSSETDAKVVEIKQKSALESNRQRKKDINITVKPEIKETDDEEEGKLKKDKQKIKSDKNPELVSVPLNSRRKNISNVLGLVKSSSIEINKITEKKVRRKSSLKQNIARKPENKLEEPKIRGMKDMIKKDVSLSESKMKKPTKPENDYQYLISIFKQSLTSFRSNAQLLPNAFMADSDIFYDLYKDSGLININHSMV